MICIYTLNESEDSFQKQRSEINAAAMTNNDGHWEMWQACDALGLSDRTIRRLIRDGQLEGDKVAGKWWVKKIDPEGFAATARHGTARHGTARHGRFSQRNYQSQ